MKINGVEMTEENVDVEIYFIEQNYKLKAEDKNHIVINNSLTDLEKIKVMEKYNR